MVRAVPAGTPTPTGNGLARASWMPGSKEYPSYPERVTICEYAVTIRE